MTKTAKHDRHRERERTHTTTPVAGHFSNKKREQQQKKKREEKCAGAVAGVSAVVEQNAKSEAGIEEFGRFFCGHHRERGGSGGTQRERKGLSRLRPRRCRYGKRLPRSS